MPLSMIPPVLFIAAMRGRERFFSLRCNATACERKRIRRARMRATSLSKGWEGKA